MLEVLLLMFSVGVQSVPTASGDASTQFAAEAVTLPAAQSLPAAEPEQSTEQSTEKSVEPVAEQSVEPVAEPSVETVAPPAFLSPDEPQLVAEPQVPTGKFTTALEVKPILNATRGNWITVREFNGQDLVYVTHLWSWRCGLLELRIGLNGNTPEPWPMPDCHLDQPAPGMILDTDGLPYRGFGLGSIAMIEVQITYDDLTTDVTKYNRQGVPIQ